MVNYDAGFKGADLGARAISEKIADGIRDARETSENLFLDVAEAVSIAQEFDSADGPLVISDYADNLGSGAYGDAANLLKAMLEGKLQNAAFGRVIDPEAAAGAAAHTLGFEVTARIGGMNDPSFGGGPLDLTGEIRLISDRNIVGDGPIRRPAFLLRQNVRVRVSGIAMPVTAVRCWICSSSRASVSFPRQKQPSCIAGICSIRLPSRTLHCQRRDRRPSGGTNLLIRGAGQHV
ncbi:MlrC C-terminal domain-containing protein [Mesorhizobium sp. M0047]|uniref:MlrC C-terminal domain-containing protein n=1 Tax=Mesorhizobium sp. M0047 TaxID=2956859 RepID=UPI00333CF390